MRGRPGAPDPGPPGATLRHPARRAAGGDRFRRSSIRIVSGRHPSHRSTSIEADERRVRLGLVALAFIWGLNFPLVKLVLGSVPPLAFNALRFPVAAVAIALLLPSGAATQPLRLPERGDRLRLVLVSLLGNVAYQLLFIVG
ncbi:MAG: EamA family transporter, partial [Longimicrobiales bacterium]|nr:EamA family transporter [Longimicrobiales bacterium]